MSKSLRRSATPGSSYNHANNPTSKPVSSSTVKSKPSSTVRGTTTRSGSTKPDSMTSSKTIRSTTKPVAGSSKTTRTRSSTRTKKSIPLFIDSGDDEEEEGEGENFARELEAVSEEDEDEVENEIGGTLRTDGMRTQGETQSKTRGRSGAGGVKRTGSRKIAVVMDDDSDDGVTFKGFAKKTRAKRG